MKFSLLAFLCAFLIFNSCTKKGKNMDEGIKAFADSLETKLDGVARQMNLEDWNFYTTGEKGRLEEFQKQWSDIVLNPTYFEKAKEYRGKTKDAILSRRIELIYQLLLGEKVNALESIYQLRDSLSQIDLKFRATYQGKEVTNNELYNIMRYEKNREKRKEAYLALAQVGEKMHSGLAELMSRRNEEAKKLGYANYYELGLEQADIKKDFLFDLLTEIDSISLEPYKQLLQEWTKRLNVSQIESWDLYYVQGDILEKLSPYFPKEKQMLLLKETMKDIGIDLDSIPIKYDIEPRPGKSQLAYSFAIHTPDDIRILANIDKGINYCGTMFHETGHSVQSVFINQPSYLLREYTAGCFNEGMAQIIAGFLYQPEWLKKYTKIPDELIKKIKKMKREDELLSLRSSLLRLNFEYQAYLNPTQDLNKLYWNLYEKYVLLPGHPEIYSWSSLIYYTTHPVYLQNYLLADLIQAQTFAYLKSKNGSMVSNPKIKEFLLENYFKPGASISWDILVEKATGEPLSPKYLFQEIFER
jgi:oligoendopeptidase F